MLLKNEINLGISENIEDIEYFSILEKILYLIKDPR